MVVANGITEYPIHPLVEVFQPYDAERYETLRDSIKGYGGLRQPITLWQGQIIDGRHRYRACVELGLEPWVVELDDAADPLDAVVDLNGVRRQMTSAQRAMVAAQISADSKVGGDRMSADHSLNLANGRGGYTQDRAAKALGVSVVNVKNAKQVLESGEEVLYNLLGNQALRKASNGATESGAKSEGWK